MVDDQLRIDGAMSRLVSDSMCLRPYSLSVLSAGKLDIARLWVRLDHHAAPRHRAVAWRRIAAVKFDVIELVARARTHRLCLDLKGAVLGKSEFARVDCGGGGS